MFPSFEISHLEFSQFTSFAFYVLAVFLIRVTKSAFYRSRSSLLLESTLASAYIPIQFGVLFSALWQFSLLILAGLDVDPIFTFHQGILGISLSCVTWFLFRIINRIETYSLNAESGKLDPTAVSGVAKVVRLLLTLIIVIALFDVLGLDASGLIALGSVSGAALAFASKDLVSNWFGGIMLYLDKPFRVGDWIRSPDRDIEGTVEYIGWRITKIRTFDKRPLYVPNAIFNNVTVQNPSRMTHRRFNETIGIRYQDVAHSQQLVSDIEAYIKNSELVAQDQTIIVNVNKFNASSIDILVYCMTVTTEWEQFHQDKQQILLAISDLVEKNQCEFAFPTQSLHVESLPAQS